VHGVDVGEGSHGVGEEHDSCTGSDGAHGVRRVANGYELGLCGDFDAMSAMSRVTILVWISAKRDRDATVFGHLQPRRTVASWSKTRDYDFGAGLKFATNGALRWRSRVVMFGPKATSSAPQCRKSAMAARSFGDHGGGAGIDGVGAAGCWRCQAR